MLLTDDGWIAPRRPDTLDLYVFAYGRDYRAALRAFYRLTGPQPLLPRFALGNWWSRYHPYSADEYLGLMDRFAAEGIPLSVAVLDMDWHLVDIDPRHGSGWTGYTWNRDLFPDPPAFLAALHERGLATTLNVHPAEGVHAHEERYAAIARRMGVDPDSELPVDFDPADPAFLEAYLEELHHPREAEGVDFWWLDWQQGGVTRIPGLDPLWLLNHFHFLGLRAGRRSGPLTFSRYAGVGSHRYPIGFSGDTVITWASLDFQPYFTATASNVGYGWWSHDVGGHFFGYKDDELTVRWTQLGVFSPITRLHSSDSPFNTREPWRFGERAQRIMTAFLRLRHRLVPYLHTMNRRAHRDGEPLVQPMYYDHPDDDDAYRVPQPVLLRRPAARRPDHDARGPGDGPGRRARVAAARAVDRRVHRPGLPRRHDDPAAPRPRHDPGARARRARSCRWRPVRAGIGTANPGRAGAAGVRGRGRRVHARRGAGRRAVGVHPVHARAATSCGSTPSTASAASVPATRRYDVVLCGFAGVTAVEVDGAGQRDRARARCPAAWRVRLPRSWPRPRAPCSGWSATLAPAGNRDVRERLFALLDAAQIELATKEAVHRVVTEPRPGPRRPRPRGPRPAAAAVHGRRRTAAGVARATSGPAPRSPAGRARRAGSPPRAGTARAGSPARRRVPRAPGSSRRSR